MRHRRLIATAAAVLAVGAPLAGAAKDETFLVSLQSASDGGGAAGAISVVASVSADGRFVAFQSDADNLSNADNDGFTNIFLRDTQTNGTTLVSRQSAADGGAGANGVSGSASVSADGRFVVFLSSANNLSTVDNDPAQDVFVRDLQTDTTTLATRESGPGGAGADDSSFDPTISGDGRYVAFQSAADNLSTVDDNSLLNAFVRDLQIETTSLVSRQSAADGGAPATGAGNDPFISANGRFVAFESNADNLSSEDVDTVNNIYVRDLQDSVTTFVSRQSASDGGAGASTGSFDPALSGDGRFVAFETDAQNLSASDADAAIDVFVRDIQTSTTLLASRQTGADGGAGADASSDEPSLSTDGRYVVFDSNADNLSNADNDAFVNVFVRDLQAQTTTLASRQGAADGGVGADGHSQMTYHGAGISGDGRFVVFASDADNLSTADNNAFFNVFLRDVLGAPAGPGPGPDPDPGPGTDTDPPGIDLTAKKTQKPGKPVKVKATCDEACTVELAGTVKPKGERKGKLKPSESELAAGVTETLKLKFSGKTKKALLEADAGKAKITATATDAAGNDATDKIKVKFG